MERAIVGFHQDEASDWVAELTCGHGQHVRHQPPFFQRPWVTSEAGRQEKLGALLDCVRCNESEWPDGFVAYKKTKVFTEETLPKGLRRAHQTKTGVWALIHCLKGRLKYVVEPPVAETTELSPQLQGIVVPEVPHYIEPLGPVEVYVEFFKRDV